ncbi:MAG: Uma2 family endonuclease, partial [Limnohabitans sp.]
MNPVLVVEVLSPSTEAYDRGLKFAKYRLLPSLRTYVLVSQDRPLIEWYHRSANGWLYQQADTLSADIAFEALDCRLLLAEAYA